MTIPPRSRDNLTVRLALGLMLLAPLLYLASVGPAFRYAVRHNDRFGVLPAWYEPAYAPVTWLTDNTPLRGLIHWYVDLWIQDRPKA